MVSAAGRAAPRRRGGQPGNKNALKHGFYSPGFNPTEQEDLEALAGQVDLSDEIAMMRVIMRRVFEQAGECADLGEWSAALGALGAAASRMAGLLRTQKILAGGGSGLPLHFLAEPESSNRSTAESAGGPKYRHFEQRQEFFTWLVGDLARLVIRWRALAGGGTGSSGVDVDTQIQVTGADLSARDNAALGVAFSTVVSALGELRDRGMIDDVEYLRLAYRFAGEVADVEALLERGHKAGKVKDLNPGDDKGSGAAPVAGSGKVNTETGDTKKLPRIE
ncbi:MAG: hypothetical protein GYA48_09920 [Chloroflexi bacterium]|nr:hypothetical protein [Chloroflexota bacterium]